MTAFRRDLVELLPRLRRFARVLTNSQPDADDLVQAAVERALRHASSWQQGTRLDSWMYRIIQNLWRDELRAHRRRAQPLEAAAELAGEDGRDVMMHHVQVDEAHAALRLLPADQRAVVALVILEGLAYRDAAEALEIPVGTVMSRLARARASLATSLGNDAERLKVARQ